MAAHKEVELLRAIEDAERDLATFHAVLKQLVGATVVLAGSVVFASTQVTADFGGWGALILVSSLLLVGALVVTPWWIWWNHSETRGSYRYRADGPTARLRAARREHEDFLTAQAERMERNR